MKPSCVSCINLKNCVSCINCINVVNCMICIGCRSFVNFMSCFWLHWYEVLAIQDDCSEKLFIFSAKTYHLHWWHHGAPRWGLLSLCDCLQYEPGELFPFFPCSFFHFSFACLKWTGWVWTRRNSPTCFGRFSPSTLTPWLGRTMEWRGRTSTKL